MEERGGAGLEEGLGVSASSVQLGSFLPGGEIWGVGWALRIRLPALVCGACPGPDSSAAKSEATAQPSSVCLGLGGGGQGLLWG